MRLGTEPISTNSSLVKRIVAGFAALAVAATVGAVGLAGAQPEGKPTKEQCEAAGFKNYGQCVSEWAHTKGYGGGSG